MATIFTSYAFVDIPAASSLEKRMLDKGHRTILPVGMAVAGNWREKTTKALAASDALVVVLTDAALDSRNVAGEIGAGRVLGSTKGMIVLPVLVGAMGIPDFISDIFCFRCKGTSDLDWDGVAHQLDKAIVDNVKLVPRIFISHRHKDEPIAAGLTALLEQAFYIANVPSPLNERHSVSVESEEDCLQLIDYVATRTSLRRREGTIGKVAQLAKALADNARAT